MKAKRKLVAAIGVLISAIAHYNSIRNRSHLQRQALLQPKFSPWSRLLNYGDESSFLTLTGFDFNSFRRLVVILSPDDDEQRIGGRPRMLDLHGRIGLALFFLTSHMRIKHLCMLFGIVPSTASRDIRDILCIIIRRLRADPASLIAWPDEDKKQELAFMVFLREPMVSLHSWMVCKFEFKVESLKLSNPSITAATSKTHVATMFSYLVLMVLYISRHSMLLGLGMTAWSPLGLLMKLQIFSGHSKFVSTKVSPCREGFLTNLLGLCRLRD